jgi:hypothetical protein
MILRHDSRLREKAVADLAIHEAGVRLHLERSPGTAFKDESCKLDEQSNRPRTHRWEEEINIIISACQEWARRQLRDIQNR